ncbi:MAG: methyl-accepting chemotaxis protein [Candidatus Heimdallarchaeota archaeon]|nr:methyl-accepting chemotaxis protein [Candidatus Heimdallarchaeota archaeon]
MEKRNPKSEAKNLFIFNLSIRQKFFIVFLIILLILVLQTLTNIRAYNQINDTNENLRYYSETKDLSYVTELSLQDEVGYLNERLEIGVFYYQNIFNTLFEKTNVAIDSMVEAYENTTDSKNFDNLSENEQLEITEIKLALNNITIERNNFVNLINNTIIKLPTTRIFDTLMFERFNIEYLADSYLNAISTWFITQNSTLEENIDLVYNDYSISRTLLRSYIDYIVPINETVYQDITQNFSPIISVFSAMRLLSLDLRENYTIPLDSIDAQNASAITNIFTNLYQLTETLSIALSDFEVSLLFYNSFLENSINKLILTFEKIFINLEIIRDIIKTRTDKLIQEIENQTISQNVSFRVSILIITILLLVILVIIDFHIANPIKRIAVWSNIVSEGDLSRKWDSGLRNDEVGMLQNNFKIMILKLREIISKVSESAVLLNSKTSDLAGSTEEINATAEEVAAIAQSMAKGSTQQAEIVSSIVLELRDSSEVIENVIEQMSQNLFIVRDLSDQTSLLALNTAIEAANAGDFGKGFTVIAENIRKMAIQSKNATEDITRDSREIMNKLQDVFNSIARKIENVAAVSEETAASAEEVAASAQEMTQSIQTMSNNSFVINEQATESLVVVRNFKL